MEIVLGFAVLVVIAFVLWLPNVDLVLTKSITGIVNLTDSTTASDETVALAKPTVPTGKTGVLTTRTNGTSGSITMDASGHGITTGARVDIYWADGQCYGAVVGTVSGNVIPIASVAGGTAFPIATTALTVGVCVSAAFGFVGDNATLIALYSPVRGTIVVADGAGDLLAKYLTAGKSSIWDSSDLTTNPVAGDTPTQAFFSHADTGTAQTEMKAVALHHN